MRVPPREHTLVTLVIEKEGKAKRVVFLTESSEPWEIINDRHSQPAKRGKCHQPVVLASLRAAACSGASSVAAGAVLKEAGRRRLPAAVHAPPKPQSQFSASRFFSLLAPASVQVGGETEGEDRLPTLTCSAQPKGTRRCRTASRPTGRHLPDNSPQYCDIFCVFPMVQPPPTLSERLSEGSHLRRRILI